MNFTLIATTALLVAGPVNTDMAVQATNYDVVAQMSKVELLEQATSDQNKDIVKEEVLKASQDDYIIFPHEFYERDNTLRPYPDGLASILFEPDPIRTDTDVKVTFSPTPKTSYPNVSGLDSYSSEDVRYIGPSLTVEIPLDVLDWQSGEKKSLFELRPSFFKGALDKVSTRDVFIEVRLKREDGTLVFFPFDYGFWGEVDITNLFLQTSLEGSVPEILEISAQAVDLSGVLPGSSLNSLPRTRPLPSPL